MKSPYLNNHTLKYSDLIIDTIVFNNIPVGILIIISNIPTIFLYNLFNHNFP